MKNFLRRATKLFLKIKAANQDFTEELLQAYYKEAFTEGPCASQGFRSMYQQLQVHADGDQLWIEGPSSIDTEHFRKPICQI